jgi:hypothetical protein
MQSNKIAIEKQEILKSYASKDFGYFMSNLQYILKFMFFWFHGDQDSNVMKPTTNR